MSKTKSNYLVIITTVLCLLPMVLIFSLYSKLPQEIPIHFNNAGNADNYLSKNIFAFGIPIGFALLNLFVHFRLGSDPKKANISALMKVFLQWLIPFTSWFVIILSVTNSLGYIIPINMIAMSLSGFVIIICGNYLPKSRQNYTVGIKLPWTLDSQDNWNRTHRFGGLLWILGGFVLIASNFLQLITPLISFLIILVIAVAPFVYSYILYKRGV